MTDLVSEIDKNRNLFISHNIARLRELIRYLSEDKFNLFQTIPFLLHVNLPGHPGYIDTREKFCGINRFEQSGFFQFAVDKFGLSSFVVAKMSQQAQVIQGVYLMGSVGTLTQSDKSDFDYWLVVEQDKISNSEMALLKEKLYAIEKWCFESYRQEVTFFIMDASQLRANNFSIVDSESSGSAQKTLLKEEFYRTFIVIAGRIPLWAVLPAGIKDDDYNTVLETLEDMAEKDFLDTGNLARINPDECLGAVLWQVYKARNDPVKALIKATLTAHYFFNHSRQDAVICNILKERYAMSRIGEHLSDPYTIVFEIVEKFYDDIEDHAGLMLMRKCILLRLLGYPLTSFPDMSTPKGELFVQLAGKWHYDLDALNHLKQFYTWPEVDKCAFEAIVFDKLSFIYELILRSSDALKKINMEEGDLVILVNRTASFRQKIKGKIPDCSAFLRKRKKKLHLCVEKKQAGESNDVWSIFEGDKICTGDPVSAPIHRAGNFTAAAGWLIVNRMFTGDYANIKISDCEIEGAAYETAFIEMADFFSNIFPRPDVVFETARQPEKILFYLNMDVEGDILGINGAEYLLMNSWGEFYLGRIDLSFLESIEQKCYKLAETIFRLLKKKSGSGHNFYICQGADSHAKSMTEHVKKCLSEIIQAVHEPRNEKNDEKTESASVTKRKPFLDLL